MEVFHLLFKVKRRQRVSIIVFPRITSVQNSYYDNQGFEFNVSEQVSNNF